MRSEDDIPVSNYVLSGCVPRHAKWVPALDQEMTENNTFESHDQVKRYFDHLTLDS